MSTRTDLRNCEKLGDRPMLSQQTVRLPVELFKFKIREKAKLCGFSEDLIDFEAYLIPELNYQENLAIFYRQYPQLAQQSDFLKLNQKTCGRDYRSFSKSCGVEPEPRVRQSLVIAAQPATGHSLQVTYSYGGAGRAGNRETKSKRNASNSNLRTL